MYRKKDFLLMEVVNIEGKKLGYINDILIDCSAGDIKGFILTPYKLFQKELCVLKEDIIYFNHRMVVKKTSKLRYLPLGEIFNMDVVDKEGNIIGVIEDIVFSKTTFKINAIIVSSGLINSFFDGKKIMLLKDIIVGDRNLLNYSSEKKYSLNCLPHKLLSEVKKNEKQCQ